MMTNSFTKDFTFTETNSAYIASKVAADLQSLHDYYGRPSEPMIRDFVTELVVLLLMGYVKSIQYGFERDDKKVLVLEYKVQLSGLQDSNSGRVFPRADVSDAAWFSLLTYSDKWDELSDDQKQKIESALPIERYVGDEPEDGAGYWVGDKSYSSQGVGVQRRTFRPS